jgi:hypothetical protein
MCAEDIQLIPHQRRPPARLGDAALRAAIGDLGMSDLIDPPSEYAQTTA